MRERLPNGTLIPIGGGEDREHEKTVLCRLIKETRRRKPLLCVITVASSDPEAIALRYRNAFRNIGHTQLSFIHFTLREEADSEAFLNVVKRCSGVFLTGGDQLRLASLLGGTQLLELIKQRYFSEARFVVAGTSAGAAVMSDTMIIGGSSADALVKGGLELTPGLDFINNVFIDTHFTERGRIGRVLQTIAYNPSILGIGLGEDTAVVIHKERDLEVVGSGLVLVTDGTGIRYSDLMERSDGEPITVEGFRVHVLGPGTRFSLKERKIKRKGKRGAGTQKHAGQD